MSSSSKKKIRRQWKAQRAQAARKPSMPIEATSSWYRIQNRKGASNVEAEILIYDEIGSFGITAEQFIKDLKAIDAEVINVRLNTPGGDVFDGTAIHNSLRAHPAEIIMHIDGVAASAGSFIAMSGDKIQMSNNAYLMIHNASGGVMGDAEDMKGMAVILEKIDRNIAQMYADKSGKEPKHYRDLMDAETWFTADEALAEGLIDNISTDEMVTTEPATARSKFNFSIYNKIPDPVKRMWGIQPKVTAPQASQSSEPPATEVLTQESTLMATETSNADTAQSSAAVSDTNISQNQKIDIAEARRREMDNLKLVTAEAHFENGRKKGVPEGITQEYERMKAIVSVCPGKPQMAIDAFLGRQSPESVKLAFDTAQVVEANAKTALEAKDDEITRWKALAATGGYPGGVAALPKTSDGDENAESKMDPKAQAEWEWDYKSEVRKTASSKEIYVLARTAELDGTHRSFTGKSAN